MSAGVPSATARAAWHDIALAHRPAYTRACHEPHFSGCFALALHSSLPPPSVRAPVHAQTAGEGADRARCDAGVGEGNPPDQPRELLQRHRMRKAGRQLRRACSGTPGLCKNADFELAMYTPYKMVAYEVWRVVSQKQPPPQPNYAEAQRTRITIGCDAGQRLEERVHGSGAEARREAGRRRPHVRSRPARAVSRSTFPAFAPTAAISVDLVGKDRTISCAIDAATLKRMR